MRRLELFLLVSFLLVTLAFVQKGSIIVVRASSVFQGDLILTGNNITMIEGEFDINGSIIVMGNATLFLRNAFLNFTQSGDHQFNMSLENPAQGMPQLNIENTTISSSTHSFDVILYENSTASLDRLQMPSDSIIYAVGDSNVSVKDSSFDSLWANDNSIVAVANSSATMGVNGYDSSNVRIDNCTLGHVYSLWKSNVTVKDTLLTDVDYSAYVNAYSVNSTIGELGPTFVEYWNLKTNCSTAVDLDGAAPNFTLINTQVNSWGFTFEGNSNITIFDSDLGYLGTKDLTVARLNHSSVDTTLRAVGDSRVYFLYSNGPWTTYCNGNSSVWLYMSNITNSVIENQAMILDCWFLDVHMVDAANNSVPSASVTTINQLTGRTQTELTDQNGQVELLLAEQMKNATGNYSVSEYTIQAAYQLHSNSTTVNMTSNQMITLMFSDLIIPELPSLLLLPQFMMATLLAAIICRKKHADQGSSEKEENEQAGRH